MAGRLPAGRRGDHGRLGVRHQFGPAQRFPARGCVFWDKKHGLWRVAEDDPDSDLYAESSDADAVIGYIVANA